LSQELIEYWRIIKMKSNNMNSQELKSRRILAIKEKSNKFDAKKYQKERYAKIKKDREWWL